MELDLGLSLSQDHMQMMIKAVTTRQVLAAEPVSHPQHSPGCCMQQLGWQWRGDKAGPCEQRPAAEHAAATHAAHALHALLGSGVLGCMHLEEEAGGEARAEAQGLRPGGAHLQLPHKRSALPAGPTMHPIYRVYSKCSTHTHTSIHTF